MILDLSRTPLARADPIQHRRELALSVRSADVLLPRIVAHDARSTVAGTAWTRVLGCPWQIFFDTAFDVELAAEIQWELTATTAPSATSRPFEARFVWDDLQVHSGKVVLQQALLTQPAPSPIAAGSLHLTTTVPDAGAGLHRLELQIKAPASTTWTALDSSYVRHVRYPR